MTDHDRLQERSENAAKALGTRGAPRRGLLWAFALGAALGSSLPHAHARGGHHVATQPATAPVSAPAPSSAPVLPALPTPIPIGPDTNAPSVPTGLVVLDGYCGDALVVWTLATDDRDPQASLRYEVYVDGDLDQVVTGGRYASVLVDYTGSHTFEVIALDTAGNASAAASVTAFAGGCE